MRIVEVRELAVPLEGGVANAVVNFSEHTVSLVAVVTDVVRHGRRVAGLGFNSIGRFAQGGILRDRMIPRLLAAAPDSLLDAGGERFDAGKVLAVLLRNEKPGGHGDRAGAAAAIEQAIWDLNAKLADEPAYMTIARAFGRVPSGPVEVYTGGGYYYAPGTGQTLRDEFQRYRDMGFESFKMKIGGAPLLQDMKRVEEALDVAGGGDHLMVDANGRFDLETALAYAQELQPLALRWFEEIGDPLDYRLNAEVIEAYGGAVATGENLFSAIDTLNLVRFGGMRPGHDVFQMDPGLSYGITEYARMLQVLESHGFDRRQAIPHGGHLINLHVVVGLGLGACEAYPGVFQPFGGYSPQCEIRNARVRPSEAAGFGLEEKKELTAAIRHLLA
ncbi:MAG: mandelate racemase [Betaproteobacteria bacterium]|nr:mandelate racemase [Betaproteobacteria bacterium]